MPQHLQECVCSVLSVGIGVASIMNLGNESHHDTIRALWVPNITLSTLYYICCSEQIEQFDSFHKFATKGKTQSQILQKRNNILDHVKLSQHVIMPWLQQYKYNSYLADFLKRKDIDSHTLYQIHYWFLGPIFADFGARNFYVLFHCP